jgi:hypothetical protein
MAALLSLAGMLGGGALGEIGRTSDDIASALGIFGGLLLLVAGFPQTIRAAPADLAKILLPAGILVGASLAMKLTTAPYAVGLGAGLLTLTGSPWRRLRRSAAFGVGIAIGLAIFGGFWFWTLWRYSGNPFFPYFNAFFPSPLVPPMDYRDGTFYPKSWTIGLFFPFVFSLHYKLVAEIAFRDIHVAILYVLVPATALAALLGVTARDRLVDPLMARLLLVMAVVAYVLWLALFSIYRYLVPLEMLAPAIIAVAAGMMPWRPPFRAAAAASLLIVAQAVAQPGLGVRHSWDGSYVALKVPVIADPARTMVLMTAYAPMAYVIPEFPPEIRFVRIQSYLVHSDDTTYGLGRTMHDLVARHDGPLYVLFWPKERPPTLRALKDYGLALDDAGCQVVPSTIEEHWNDGMSLQFCPVEKVGG